MKLTFFLAVISVVSTYAQSDYTPFLDVDKHWIYDQYDRADSNPAVLSSYMLWTSGDTMISDMSYKFLTQSTLKGSHPCQFPPCFVPDIPYELDESTLIGYIRENVTEEKVYYLPELEGDLACTQDEYELYDFTLAVSEDISSCHKMQISQNATSSEDFGTVDSINTLYVYDKARTTLYFEGPEYLGLTFLSTKKLIEGVGLDYYDPINHSPFAIFSGFCEGTLEDCNIISSYQSVPKAQISLWPNPASTFISIKSDMANQYSNTDIYNTSGQLMISPVINLDNIIDVQSLKKGIYYLGLSYEDQSSTFYKFVKL